MFNHIPQNPTFNLQNKPTIPMTYDFAKAGKNGTLITVILDESGSMDGVRDQTISAFNEFIQGQRSATKDSGRGLITLMKFDSPELKTIYTAMPLEAVPLLSRETYAPRGGTNLFDAVGTAMANTTKYLNTLALENRPGVIMVIMTDGEENSSRMFRSEEIRNMVRAAENNADWTFTFLGANIDAFSAGSNIGMGVHNTVQYDVNKMGDTMTVLGEVVGAMRTAKSAGVSTAQLYSQGLYTDEQRSRTEWRAE